MTDLLYFGYVWEDDSKELEKEFKSEINHHFSDVELKDAFDDIKGYRQEVTLPKGEEDDYMAWVVARGWLSYSMIIQLRLMSNKEEFERVVGLAKRKYPSCFKKKCT